MQKRFTFYGSLQLSYEERWCKGALSRPSTVEFITGLDLGMRGFVVDPRLVNFEVTGLLARDSRKNLGRSYTLTGGRLDVMLLESLPKQWLGSWMFIPNPIILRFSRVSDTYETTNYGITLAHRMPEEVKLSKRYGTNGDKNSGNSANEEDVKFLRRNGVNGDGIPFPLTIFDYDHYDYSDNLGFKSTTNLYSLRSSIRGDVYDYSLLLEKSDQTGNTETERFTLEFQPNYRFFDPRTKRTWDIFNQLRYDKINETKNYQGHSSLFYRKPMGDSRKDMFLVTGDLTLSKISAEGFTTSTYDAFARAEYEKHITARLLAAPFAEVGYTRATERGTEEIETLHFERAGTRIEADLSRVFRNTSEVFIGNGQSGLEYGVNTMFTTKTRINAAAGYSFSTISLPEGRFSLQQLVLRASGPVFGNLSFDSWVNYTLQDTSGTEDKQIGNNFFDGVSAGYIFPEDSLRASANLYWFFRRTSVSAGGSWMQSDPKKSLTGKTTSTAFQASLSQVLTRRTFFSVYSSWIKDSQKNETIEVLPRLSWSRGKTSINLDYDYRGTTILDGKQAVEHRIFFRLVRSFSHDFKL